MIILSMLLASVAHAQPAYNFFCDYQFASLPFAVVKLEIRTDGSAGPVAYVNLNGAAREVDTKPIPTVDPMILSLWLNHDQEGEAIEMRVWRDLRSKLINHTLPFGKEVLGRCRRGETR